MRVWAIKHKPTNEWMPARMFRTSVGGWSYWIPGPAPEGWSGYDGHDKNPRLFFKARSAANALTMWLQGTWERKQGTTVDWEGIPDGYDDMMCNAPPIERKREDMEIVELELTGPGL